MKKTAIALAVAAIAAAPLAAQADAGAYSSIRLAVVNADDGANDAWDMTDEASRFGFKGREDLGNGMYAFGRYEFGVNADDTKILDSNRLSYIGFGGDFGEVSIGRQWAPFYLNVSGAGYDQFNAVGANLIRVNSSGNARISIRTSDSIKYTNSFGPVNFAGLVVMNDGGAADTDDLDRIEATVTYAAGPLTISGGIAEDAKSFGDDSVVGATVSYKVTDAVTVKGLYESYDVNVAGTDAIDTMSIYGSVALGGGLSASALLGTQDNNGADTTEFAIGLNKSLSKSSRVFVEYNSVDPDGGAESSTLAFGGRVDW